MKQITRRRFVQSSMIAGAAATLPACATTVRPFGRVRGANDDIRVAIIGIRGKGGGHINVCRKMPGVRVVAICDPDVQVLAKRAEQFTKDNEHVNTYRDMRYIFDRHDIDAVTTATPNHWHALVTIWACESGKHVYVEKPASHNIWEGRQMVKAARKYKRIVQVGTQQRSDMGLHEAIDYIRKGNLGEIKLVRGMCYKRRGSIGKVDGPQQPPPQVDHNLWTGPAPLQPVMRQSYHYDWHWQWEFGNGDIGNQGPHQMDVCRWVVDQQELPRRVMSIGGRFGYDDDGQTANTQIAFYDYDPVPIIFEVQGLPRQSGAESMDHYRGIRTGNVIHCEGGYYACGTGGGWAYDNDGKKIKQFTNQGSGDHHANFFKAVRNNNVNDLNAEIEQGHLSAALSHLANISHRVGAEAPPGEVNEVIKGDKDASETFERFGQHLAANGIDINKTHPTLGPWIEVDPRKETCVNEYQKQRANELLVRDYRHPFIVPKYA